MTTNGDPLPDFIERFRVELMAAYDREMADYRKGLHWWAWHRASYSRTALLANAASVLFNVGIAVYVFAAESWHWWHWFNVLNVGAAVYGGFYVVAQLRARRRAANALNQEDR